MSELAIIALFGTHTALVVGVAGWLFSHERGCDKRWSEFMKEHGRVMQILSDRLSVEEHKR